MFVQDVQPSRSFIAKLPYGQDLLQVLTDICLEKKIQAGRVEVIGALQDAAIAYYEQQKKQYVQINLPGEWEIVSCIGNISLKQGQSMVHAHIALADSQGHTFGGHLVQGCKIFAGECLIQEFSGALLERELDETTRLPLWVG